MKTAIPDQLFNDTENTAKQLGLARSQLYAEAIKEFIQHHKNENITAKLNELYSREKSDDNLLDLGVEQLRRATENDLW